MWVSENSKYNKYRIILITLMKRVYINLKVNSITNRIPNQINNNILPNTIFNPKINSFINTKCVALFVCQTFLVYPHEIDSLSPANRGEVECPVKLHTRIAMRGH